MEIITTPQHLIENITDRGRPPKYPFLKLNPGETLVFDNCTIDDLTRIKSALYQFKKNNKLNWLTSVKFDKNNIYVSLLK